MVASQGWVIEILLLLIDRNRTTEVGVTWILAPGSILPNGLLVELEDRRLAPLIRLQQSLFEVLSGGLLTWAKICLK